MLCYWSLKESTKDIKIVAVHFFIVYKEILLLSTSGLQIRFFSS
jgi:hypothetical protein